MTYLRLAILSLSVAFISGCQFIGMAAESQRREVPQDVKAEYRGMEGKSFAVVVAADRFIQSEHPGLVDYLTNKVTERLAARTNEPVAGAYIPAPDVLRYLYNNPGWSAKPMMELAAGLGNPQRIVMIEVSEFRLNEPGNQYEWSGIASGTLSVIDMESSTPDQYAVQKNISVTFPDGKGYGPNDMSRSQVMSALALRFVDRSVWPMLDHKEMYYSTY